MRAVQKSINIFCETLSEQAFHKKMLMGFTVGICFKKAIFIPWGRDESRGCLLSSP